MTAQPADPIVHPPDPPPWPGVLGVAQRATRHLETGIVIAALVMMVVLPLLDILIRPLTAWHVLGHGITGSTEFVQHGSLLVGILGASLAARRNRLLSLATTEFFPKGWPADTARLIAAVAGVTVSALLAWASVEFIRADEANRLIIAYGIPRWAMTSALPVGFGLIALRILWHASPKWFGRTLVFLASFAILAFAALSPFDPARLVWPALIALVVASFLGAPIFVLLGGAAIILFWGEQTPIASIPVDHYRLVTDPHLPAIPLFTLAGYLLAEGGASRRLVDVFSAWFGWLRGGPAIVAVLICAFFTSFTGASGVTILALGGLLMPILLAARFSERNALGLLTGAGSLGMLLPPCLPLVLYAIIAKLPIEQIFLAAIIPGLIQIAMVVVLGVWQGSRDQRARQPFVLSVAAGALWRAKWEMLLPVVALVALFGGWATPVEAAAVTAFYALLTQTLLSRDLNLFRDVPRAVGECGLVVGGVLLILGVAQGFTNYLIFAQVPDRAVEAVTSAVSSPATFLLLLNLFLLVVGCLMDIYSAIVVVVPLILPLGQAYGIHPLHLGVIFLANLELGFLTPPVGMNLFLSSYRFNKPMSEVCLSVLPTLAVLLLSVILITYVPATSTFLPWFFSR